MPTFGLSYRDTRRWLACLSRVAQQMVAEGWNRHARKFHQVQQRRAIKMYNTPAAG